MLLHERSDTIRHNAIHRVIAAANDVAGPNRCDMAQARSGYKERLPPGLNREFGRGFTHRVNVVSAELLSLAQRLTSIPVLTTLVRCNDARIRLPPNPPNTLARQ